MTLQSLLLFVISIATRFSVYVLNYARDDEATKVLTPKKDGVMTIDCMCAVSDTRVSVHCKSCPVLFILSFSKPTKFKS